VTGAQVTLRAADSQWNKTASTNDAGEFSFDAVRSASISSASMFPALRPKRQKVTLNSGRDAKVHFSLTLSRTLRPFKSLTRQPP